MIITPLKMLFKINTNSCLSSKITNNLKSHCISLPTTRLTANPLLQKDDSATGLKTNEDKTVDGK